METFEPESFTHAIVFSTVDLYSFLPVSVALTEAQGYSVS